jgi:uncharacterized protein YbbC (DUF1343 family)
MLRIFSRKSLKAGLLFLSAVCAFNVQSHAESKVLLGIDVLEKRAFQDLEGKRVGLLTNPAGVNSKGKSSVEVLFEASNVNLVALFGPEHGIRGDELANQPVPNRKDPSTKLPVYSLYGPTRKPTPQMLANIDVFVIDLQDIGSRSYTYISCMRLAIEACFEEAVEVIVLDRPNPLGGQKVDGPGMDAQYKSYVGAFDIPYIHGLTIGEIALIAKKTEGWLEVPETIRKEGVLTIVPMVGWKREMTWPDTGLEWVPTSPSIPTFAAVLGYAMIGLGCEINGFRHGYGTNYPFRLLSFRGIEDEKLIPHLKNLNTPGVAFKMVEARTNKDQPTSGVYVQISNWQQLEPTRLSFELMPLACKLAGSNPYAAAKPSRATLFNKHVGSHEWWVEISTKGAAADVDRFLKKWKLDNEQFRSSVANFLIYR